jgi:hypothetical protein
MNHHRIYMFFIRFLWAEYMSLHPYIYWLFVFILCIDCSYFSQTFMLLGILSVFLIDLKRVLWSGNFNSKMFIFFKIWLDIQIFFSFLRYFQLVNIDFFSSILMAWRSTAKSFSKTTHSSSEVLCIITFVLKCHLWCCCVPERVLNIIMWKRGHRTYFIFVEGSL